MIIEVKSDGIHIRARDWKEEQVFKLLVHAISEGDEATKVFLDTWKGEPAYALDRRGMEYVGEEE